MWRIAALDCDVRYLNTNKPKITTRRDLSSDAGIAAGAVGLDDRNMLATLRRAIHVWWGR